MYGRYADKQKDKDQIKKEQEEAEQQKLQNKSQALNVAKNVRFFNHRLQRFSAYSIFNRIEILDCDTLAVIDVIQTSHSSEIQCFDIAEISKDIVSYSTLSVEGLGEVSKHLVVCGLKDTSYLNGIDDKVTQELRAKCGRRDEGTTQPPQVLKWIEYWRCDPKNLTFQSFLNTVSLSPHGDALALCGNQFMSLWTRDTSMSTHSYSLYLYYAKEIPKNMYAQCLEERNVLQVIQSEFSADGRTLLTLEESNVDEVQSLKVWYNVKMRGMEEPKIRKAFISRNPKREPEKGEVFRTRVGTTDLEYLDYYSIPISARNGRLLQFRTLDWPQSFYADMQVIPITFLVMTDKSQAQLWVENLNFSPSYDKQDPNDDYEVLSFSCVHVFGSGRPRKQPGCYFDAQLLQQSAFLNSTYFKEPEMDGRSSILDPAGEDHIQLAKTVVHERMFDNMIQPQLQGSISKDFIVVLTGNKVQLYSVLGLRNFPTRALEVTIERETSFGLSQRFQNRFFNFQHLVASFSDSLSENNHLQDTLSLVCLNQEQSFVKLTKGAEENSLWKVDALKAKGTHQSSERVVDKVVAASHLPVVAILENQSSILFYFEARSAKTVRNQQVLHDDFRFMGQYLSSASNLKQLKWIPGLFQMLVLQDDGKLNLVSSKTLGALMNTIAARGDFTDVGALHHQKLQSQIQIETFLVIQEDVLAKAEPEGDIIDYGVIGVQFLLPNPDAKVVQYQVNFVVMTLLNIHFYELVLSFGTGADKQVKIQTIKLNTKPLGESLKMHAILSELTLKQDNGKAFEAPNPKLKCVLQVVNAQCQFEVAFVEISKDDFCLLWQKSLPGQVSIVGAIGASSTRVDPRGGPARPIAARAAPALEPRPLDYDVMAKISPKYATVLTRSIGKNWYYLYLYEHQMLNKYVGFLDLLDFIDFEPYDSAVLLKQGFALDYELTQAQGSETILLTCLDRLHVICHNRQQQHWQCLRKVDLVTGIDIRNIKSVKVISTFEDNILLVYNNKQLASLNSCLQVYGADTKQEDDKEPIKSLVHMGFSVQRSNPIHSIYVLRQLYINGKIEFIMKMLIQMNAVLKRELLDVDKQQEQLDHNTPLKISSILNLTLQSLVSEVNAFVEAQVVQQDLVAAAEAEAANAKAPVKKDDHDGFFGSDDDSDSGMEDFDNPPPAPVAKAVVKKEEVKEIEKDRKIEQQFLEIYMELLTSITKLENQFGSKELVDFILIFKEIYAKDFFSDDMAATLLRQIYLETQIANKDVLKELEIHSKKIEETQVVKRLQDHEIYAQMYGEKEDGFESQAYQNKGQGNLNALEQWDSRKCALALFTVNQDVVLEELQSRFDLESNSSWQMVRRLCLPVWIKDDYKLRMMVEWIAKAAYRIAGEDQMKSTGVGTTPISKAEATSLWYLLMNKKSVLISLYEKEKGTGGDKVAGMLAQDFSIERWKKAALKNAGVLRAKQRFLLCITFLILGDDINAALQVIKQNLCDPIMAIITCRMLLLQRPGDKLITDALHQLYEDFFISRGKQFGDVYLQSIGLWNQGKVVQAVNVLQKPDQSELSQESLGTKYVFEPSNGFQIKDQNSKNSKKVQKDKYFPLVSETIGYELNKMVIKLKKAPKVTHALKDDEGSTGYGADVGDIFADFMGGPATKTETKKEEPKVVKHKLEVDGSKLLNQSLYQCYLKQDMLQAIFLLRENREEIDPNDRSQMQYILIICTQIMKDQVEEIYDGSNFSDEQTSLCNQIDFLLNFALDIRKGLVPKENQDQQNKLQIQKRFMQRFIQQEVLRVFEIHQNCGAKKTSGNFLLRYELELRLEAKHGQQNSMVPGLKLPHENCKMNKMMIRMEEETFKFMDFLVPIVEKPFLENNSKPQQYSNFLALRTIIEDLEHHIECLIIFDHFEDEDVLELIKAQFTEVDNLDAQEIQFFNAKGIEEAKEEPKQEVKKVSQFDDMFGEDSSSGEDLMDFDPDAPKPSAKPGWKEGASGQDQSKPVLSSEDIQSYKLIEVQELCERSIQRLNSKIKQIILMYLYLIVVAQQTQKFYIVKDLVSKDDLLASLDIDSNVISNFQKRYKSVKEQVQSILSLRLGDRNGQAQQLQNQIYNQIKDLLASVKVVYDNFHFQNIKMHIQKFRIAIQKKISLIEKVKNQQNKKGEDDLEQDQIAPEANEEGIYEKLSLNQELWEADLFEAEKEVATIDVNLIPQQEGSSPLKQVEGDERQILFGLLASQGHLNSQVYEFLRLWLNFIVINKTSEFLTNSWLSKETDDVFSSIPCSSIAADILDKTQSHQVNQNVMAARRANQIVEVQSVIFNPFYKPSKLTNKFKRMSKSLEDECSLFFQQKLSVLQRKYIASVIGNQNSDQLFPYLMKYFFKNQEKTQAFWKAFGVSKNYGKPLNNQYLTLLGRECTAEQEQFETKDQITYKSGGYNLRTLLETKTPVSKQKEEKLSKAPANYSASSLITQELLGTGIELFKQRGEQISDFAFDNTSNSDNIALGLMTSGIREIPVVNTLLFRNRIESGLQLIDEENLKWEECLHRYEQIAQIMYQPTANNANQPEIISAKDEPIITSIDSLYCHKTLQHRSKPLQRRGLDFVSQVIEPPKNWNGSNSEAYLAQTSKLDITHEDYTYPVESHPNLPLYMSGNRRGIICTWKFGRDQDKSLNQFMPEIDPRQADPKKACVKKIMFNQYGDKIMANNMEGSFSIYQIDCHSKHMRKTPIFSLYENMDCKVNDFDLVNSDNIICTISQKQKTVKIYDTLLPYCLGKNTEVMSVKLPSTTSGGNMILCNKRKQSIYTFNGRTGAMTELDLRMGLQQINQFQLSESHEITAACLNDRQDTLITGYKDGFIKIHATDKYYEPQDKEQKYLQLREKIDAFPFDFRSKKGTVQRIKQNKTGGIFASSQSGILKMVRTSV